MTDPRRIAFIGDWHANGTWAVKAIAYAKDHNADIIVHVGDFAYQFEIEFLAAVDSALHRAGLDLWFIEGNHDNPGKLRKRPGPDGLRYITEHIRHIPRGHRWRWGGLAFLGCGGAHSVDRPWRTPGVSWWPEEAITDEDVKRCAPAGGWGGLADFLIAHDCPTGVTIPGIDDRTGPPPFPPLELQLADEHRRQLRRIVDAVKPQIIVHGHYHVAYQQFVDAGAIDVVGLDCDGSSLDRNVRFYDLDGGWVDA